MDRRLFTSESVTEGHPDKMCDAISDAILDAIFEQDPYARVACETMATTGLVAVAGEITTEGYVDIQTVVRNTIKEIGYDHKDMGFDGATCGVISSIHEQSPDIAMGVDVALEDKNKIDEEKELGAGDQGMMFGFACDETPELMPMPISLANKLARRLSYIRKQGIVDYLRPDGKTQVTVEYDEEGRPFRIDTIVISAQHKPEITQEEIKRDLKTYVIDEVIDMNLIDERTKIFINPTGKFVLGGPAGDTGLTGRKIIVDTYGGYSRHGGGAFSGKDPTKVDRSGAYMARYIAKNIVAADLAKKCEVQLAYAIGVANPVSVIVDTFGTGLISEKRIVELIKKTFELTPSGIIKSLGLRRPIYRQLASYGHFGRTDIELPWEKTDKVEELRRQAMEI